MKKKIILGLVICVFVLMTVGCTVNTTQQNTVQSSGAVDLKDAFVILSSSENQSLEPIIQKFAKEKGKKIVCVYKGSVDSMLELKNNPEKYDAAWISNGLWIDMGDTKNIVKHKKSIMTSPVVLGIQKDIAQELGWVNKDVTVKDILTAIQNKKFTYIMTSASQSNSGASAYLGFLKGLSGKEVIDQQDLDNPALQKSLKDIFAGVTRSSGSSGYLKDLFLKGKYDAMFNYEAGVIETNQELVKQGKDPLYVVYPVDGLSIADYTMGYINKGDTEKEKLFLDLQNYLLSSEVQKEILKQGRRTGFGGIVDTKSVDKTIFNPDWGINLDKVLSPIKYPSSDVIYKALNLYQSELRKPSYTVFALDYSGSMGDNNGSVDLKNAMEILLKQDKAKNYLLQSTSRDVTIIIPFNDSVIDIWKTTGREQLGDLYQKVNRLNPDGGTDIYSPVITGIKELRKDPNLKDYIPSVILMTDGQSNKGLVFHDLKAFHDSEETDIPVFTIPFGDADKNQLTAISDLTRAKFFSEGKKDLIGAFKNAKGYN